MFRIFHVNFVISNDNISWRATLRIKRMIYARAIRTRIIRRETSFFDRDHDFEINFRDKKFVDNICYRNIKVISYSRTNGYINISYPLNKRSIRKEENINFTRHFLIRNILLIKNGKIKLLQDMKKIEFSERKLNINIKKRMKWFRNNYINNHTFVLSIFLIKFFLIKLSIIFRCDWKIEKANYFSIYFSQKKQTLII